MHGDSRREAPTANLTIRKLDPVVKERLRVRAARHGHSMEEEVRRILLSLSDAFRRRAADLHRTVDASTELDVLQARASFSSLIDGQEPAIHACILGRRGPRQYL